MLLSLLFCIDAGAKPACQYKQIDLKPLAENDGLRIKIIARNLSEGTVTLKLTRPSNLAIPNPYTFIVNGSMTFKIPTVSKGPYSYDEWRYASTIGIPSQRQPLTYLYSLPYPRSYRFYCTQSSYGSFSHHKGTRAAHAVDFRMPIGTEICAARPGKVVGFRSDSSVGGAKIEFYKCDNFIIVGHGDGTYAYYGHLKKDGVKVSLGQQVSVGQVIGLSGVSGFTSGPHLHFEVYRVENGEQQHAVPIKFLGPQGQQITIEKGKLY
jgi:murein DD-endopeptidase MepM/ murein hydrolase activator NlpD